MFQYKMPESLGASCTIKLTQHEHDSFGYYFVPNRHCREKMLQKFKALPIEQRMNFHTKYYNEDYRATRFHEGASFGLQYAYDNYLNLQKCAIAIEILPSERLTHDLVAYTTTMALVKLMKIMPQNPPHYSKKRKRFIFPNATIFPIGSNTINDIKKLYPDLPQGLKTEILNEVGDFIQDYFNR